MNRHISASTALPRVPTSDRVVYAPPHAARSSPDTGTPMAGVMTDFLCDTCWALFADGTVEHCPGEAGQPGCGADRGKGWTRLPHEIAPGLVAEHRLGRGGFAAVFLCHADRGRTPVAVKVARRDGPRGESGKPKRVEAFEYEIRIATRVSDASAFASVHSSAFKPEPFLALEYLAPPTSPDGVGWRPLEELVHPGGPGAAARALPLEDVLDLAVALLRGLVLLHRSGIVHRDLHPGNLFVRRGHDGELQLKVIDYGLAADINAATIFAAPRLGPAGRAHYASPDQMAGAPADPADDMYTVGCVLWEALAGARPSSAEASRPPAMPEAIAAALKDTLATARQARPSAVELLHCLEPLQREHAARRLTRTARDLYGRVKPLGESLGALQRLSEGVDLAKADPGAFRKDLEQRRVEVRERLASAHADLNGGRADAASPARAGGRWRRPALLGLATAALGVVVGFGVAPRGADGTPSAADGTPSAADGTPLAADGTRSAADPVPALVSTAAGVPSLASTAEPVAAAQASAQSPTSDVAPVDARPAIREATEPTLALERALQALFVCGSDDLGVADRAAGAHPIEARFAPSAALSIWGRARASGAAAIRDWSRRWICGRFPDARLAPSGSTELADGWWLVDLVFQGTFEPGLLPSLDARPVPDPASPTLAKGINGNISIRGAALVRLEGAPERRVIAVDLFLDGGAALAQLGYMPATSASTRARWPLGGPSRVSRDAGASQGEREVRAVFDAYTSTEGDALRAKVEPLLAPGFSRETVWDASEHQSRESFLTLLLANRKDATTWWLGAILSGGAGLVVTLERGAWGKGEGRAGYCDLAVWQVADGLIARRQVYANRFSETTLDDRKAEWLALFGTKREPPPLP